MFFSKKINKKQPEIKEKVLNAITKILETDEKIIWVGNRQGPIFRFTEIFISFFFLIFLTTIIKNTMSINDNSFFLKAALWFVSVLLSGGITSLTYWLIYTHKKNTVYVLTNRRIIIRTRVFTEKVKHCYYSDIKFAHYDTLKGYLFASLRKHSHLTNQCFWSNLLNGSPRYFVFFNQKDPENTYRLLSDYINKDALNGDNLFW